MSVIPIVFAIAFTLVLLLFYIWVVAWLARKFGAERGQKRNVLLYLVIITVFQIVVAIILFSVFFSGDKMAFFGAVMGSQLSLVGILLNIAILAVNVFIFSKCVQLGFWRSLAVQLISIVPIFIIGIVIGILGAGFAAKFGQDTGITNEQLAIVAQGNITREILTDAVDSICESEHESVEQNQQAQFYAMVSMKYLTENNQDKRSMREVQRSAKRIEKCINEGSSKMTVSDESFNTDPSDIDRADDPEMQEMVVVKIDDPKVVVEEQLAPGYHAVKLSEARKYIGGSVIVKRKSADDMKGKLMAVEGGTLKIQQRRYGGNVTFLISSKDVTSLEAYY